MGPGAELEPSLKAKPTQGDDAAMLYAVWRVAHPRAPLTPTPTNAKALKVILAETGADGGVYLAWVAQSDDLAAARLRGAAPWPGGEVVARDDLVSLSRHIPARLPLALAWDARNRRSATAVPQQTTPNPAPSRIIIDEDGNIEPPARRWSFQLGREIEA